MIQSMAELGIRLTTPNLVFHLSHSVFNSDTRKIMQTGKMLPPEPLNGKYHLYRFRVHENLAGYTPLLSRISGKNLRVPNA